MDAVDQVHHVAQQIAAFHAVRETLKDGGDDVAAFAPAIVTAQSPQIGKKADAFGSIRALGLFCGQEGQQVRAGDTVHLGCPVAPAIRGFDDRAVILAGQFGAFLLDPLHVVEELQEHDPGQHRQAIKIAVQPLVLAHDLAGGFDDAVETLGGRQLLGRSLLAGGFGHLGIPSGQAI